MSDIEKRKELSGEENFERDKHPEGDRERESSQPADHGSVTRDENSPDEKSEKESHEPDVSRDDPPLKDAPETADKAQKKEISSKEPDGSSDAGDSQEENAEGKKEPAEIERHEPDTAQDKFGKTDLKTEIAEEELKETVEEDTGAEKSPAGTVEGGEEENRESSGEEKERSMDTTGEQLSSGETEAEEPEQVPAAEESSAEENENKEGEEDSEDEEEEKDYSTFTKEEIIHEMEELLKVDDLKQIEKPFRELKSFYDDIYDHERKEALQKFLDGGGAEVDFEFAGDALDSRFSTVYERYRTRRNSYYSNLDKEKDINLQKKHEVLEKLRSLVDGEETTTSIGALKEIQKEWKEIGPVPSQYAKSLWATYNVLIDRFYDNRSIYFELKELDRKKNLEGKIELCERAEELAASGNIKEAVKELNELHEEFKHIGPVPKEVQEEVWQRFKAASDAIYAKRKEFVGRLKKDLNENLKLKLELVEEVGNFRHFDSEKITEWNDKTREILDLQKKWESIGGLPREHAREVNKSFWSNFKSFFNNKNRFFKKLEGQRDENLTKKEELVARAEALSESDDWEETAETLKDLQKEWKNIGPVPEKHRNEVYKRFKAACDTFFERRRSHTRDVEGDYRENLKGKEKICEEIEKMVEESDPDTDRFRELQLEYDRIGYVPRNAIRKIQKRYDSAVNRFLEAVDLPGSEKSELKFAAEVNRLKSGPNSGQKIQRKESELRRMIGKLENDIALWKNNLEFFAESKTADRFRDEFSKKIQEASEQLDALKEELKVLNKID